MTSSSLAAVPRRWLLPLTIALTGLTGCLDDLRTAQNSVDSTRPLPAGATLRVRSGDTFALGVQFLDREQVGVDDADCVFVIAEPALLSFEDAAGGPSWTRIYAKADEVLGVRGTGLAVAHFVAAEVDEPSELTVFAGSTAIANVRTGAQETAATLWRFAIQIEPNVEALDGGLLDADLGAGDAMQDGANGE